MIEEDALFYKFIETHLLTPIVKMKQLISLYKEWKGRAPYKIESLPKAGSNRQYVRILEEEEGKSVIGVMGVSAEENACFIYLAKHFTAKGFDMPHIYAVSTDLLCYIQEDLGNTALYDALADARANNYNYNEGHKKMLSQTIRALAHIQVEGAKGIDFTKCIPPTHFDGQAAMFDLNYFKYSFLKTTDLPFDETRLETDMQQLANDLACNEEEAFFLYRDFQSRNVMLKDGKPHFIDFQGGMRGPLQYDIASFLWQASARYPASLRNELINDYIKEVSTLLPAFDERVFRQRLQLFVLFRILQVLGTYGLRGYFEHKKYFLDSIPLAIENLQTLLHENAAKAYPYLEEILKKMVALPKLYKHSGTTVKGKASVSKYDGQGPLTVRVFSFSYKKGIPQDTTGNGGGYVFDCRSIHNPGRYEQYKPLTGLDQPVADFLEEDGEILTFLNAVYQLADAHVERYMKRGFRHLMFSFGCTGGRHRSVYSAQHLAEHIHHKYGIEVQLQHIEQNISTTLKKHCENG